MIKMDCTHIALDHVRDVFDCGKLTSLGSRYHLQASKRLLYCIILIIAYIKFGTLPMDNLFTPLECFAR